MVQEDILITDVLFVGPTEERRLEAAGYRIDRLKESKASEETLRDRIKGKVGYILGGIEQVTPKVLESADKLKAIVFTGSGYSEFIPALEEATNRGIAIANAPGGNADAVAEYTVTLMLAMTRRIFELGRTGSSDFATTKSLKGQRVGIVGLGHVGTLVARYLRSLGVREVNYFSRRRKYYLEAGLGLRYMDLNDLLKWSDIVTLHTSKDAGEHFIGESQLALMHDGALLVNTSYPDAVDPEALKKELATKRLRAAFDAPPKGNFKDLPLTTFFSSNAQTAYNTEEAIQMVSEMVTTSLINLLKTGDDIFLVNPQYKAHARH